MTLSAYEDAARDCDRLDEECARWDWAAPIQHRMRFQLSESNVGPASLDEGARSGIG